MVNLDCIIIGYNDIDFDAYASRQKRMAKHSGGYHEVKTNSLFLNGKRKTYMDVINHSISMGTGSDPHLSVFEAPALGACYLKNALDQQNFGTEVINFFNYEKDRLADLLLDSPGAVAITTTFYVDNAPIVEIIRFIRQHNQEVKIIVGGPHIFNLQADLDQVSLDLTYKTMGADIYIIDSQGEFTLINVLARLREGGDLDRVPNLAYRQKDQSIHWTRREVENNHLDSNMIHWRNFDKDLVAPITYLRTARSCPFACSFCNYPTMAGTHVLSGIETMEYELKTLYEIGATDIVFIDDTFNVPLPRFKKLLRMMIQNRFGFRWVSFLRCANVDLEAIELMKESGCIGCLLGIESADKQILGFMNKAAKPERYQWGIEQLNKHGIASFVSLICGFPGETESSIKTTIDFMEETSPTFFNVQLYYHDLRAPIHRMAEKFGIQGAGYNWRHNTLTWKEATEWATIMFKNIHRSTPLGLYGFSLWGISYLISRGISMEQVKSFGEITRPMLYDSIDDIAKVYPEQEERLANLFRSTQVYPSHRYKNHAA